MTDTEIDTEPVLLSSFQKFGEANAILRNLLSVPVSSDPSAEQNRIEQDWLNTLTRILDEYQEQPYLLDPYLERLVTPVVDALRSHVKDYTSGNSSSYPFARVNRLAWSMYSFVKVRGHKTIVRFFPHDVSDLPILLNYVSSDGPMKNSGAWCLRYIVMLWLSLVCMLPFDLVQFDDDGSSTAGRLEKIGIGDLDKSGLERDGAALLLSRLYMRKDTSALLASFIDLSERAIQQSPNVFAVIGSLRVIANVTKSAPFELLQPRILRMQSFINAVSSIELLSQNTLVRKLRAKCIGRIATRLLPTVTKRVRRNAKRLDPSMRSTEGLSDFEAEEESDIPDEIEGALGELFELLQDKDTLVRWSSAKGLANISERLPESFVEQIIDNILGHYAVYGSDIAPSELPATAEHPWHGATLACAEFARRNLISDKQLPDVLLWTSKALFFDVQKGSSSVGSNVRDAAAYVIWSLARTRSKKALEPHALDLAMNLVTVALFDREIHIRRAAGAAFQENVGRMGLLPHGIQIITLIDFHSVGIRRNAFLVAAPQVYRYEEYQQAILQHLLQITLRHWDEAMRNLAAQSLRKICEINLVSNIPRVLGHLSSMLPSVDVKDVHGGLIALSELACGIRESADQGRLQDHRQKIFHYIDSVPSAMVSSPRNHIITEAACYLIAHSLSSTECDTLQNTSTEPYWKTIIFQGLKSRNSDVQKAAAAAIHSLSRIRDYLRRSSGIMQQSLARVLGSFNFLAHNNGFTEVLECLLEVVDPKSSNFFRDVEARRNAYTSLAIIVQLVSPRLDDFMLPDVADRVWKAFFLGLDDYTINEKGDVGSWVRIACIQGFSAMLQTLIDVARTGAKEEVRTWVESYASFSRYLSSETYHAAIGMILKQGVERLDNVRQCVGDEFLRLLKLEPPSFNGGEVWSVIEKERFLALLDEVGAPGWNDGTWFYPKAVCFLDIKTYRAPVIRGLLLSIGSRTSTTQQLASSAMLAYARSLPPILRKDSELPEAVPPGSNDLHTLIDDILKVALENPKLNNTVVPVLHLFNIFLEGDVFFNFLKDEEALCFELLTKVIELATRNVKRLQSIQRIDESMKIVVNVFCYKHRELRKRVASQFELFLLHPFPKIRADTAETLYMALQTKDVDYDEEAEEILLETEWSTDDVEALRGSVKKLLVCLE